MEIYAVKDFLSCKTRSDLAKFFNIKLSALTYLAYGGGKRYRTFVIPKKNGAGRTICAPIGPLRHLQRILNKVLLDDSIYIPPRCVHGFARRRGIKSNALMHVGKEVVFNIDFKDFFPSISPKRVFGLFRSAPFKFTNEVASALAGLTCWGNILPPGAPTSPSISNMICFRLDRALSNLARQEGARYSRYVDDITFSTNSRRLSPAICDGNILSPSIGSAVERIISENGFSINGAKSRIARGSRKSKFVTGIKVNEKLNVPRQFSRRVKAMLSAAGKYGLAKAEQEFNEKYNKEAPKNFLSVVRGMLAHIKNIKSAEDDPWRRLYNLFCEIEGLGRKTLPVGEERIYEKIFVMKADGRQGTGFILDGRWLVTCAHIVEGAEVIKYHDWRNYASPTLKSADLIGYSKDLDIAILKPDPSDLSLDRSLSSELGSTVSSRDRVVAYGFPDYRTGDTPYLVETSVVQWRKDSKGIKNVTVADKLTQGMSGSPVLDPSSHKVIGIAFRGTKNFTDHDRQIHNTFLSIDHVASFAEGLSAVGSTIQP